MAKRSDIEILTANNLIDGEVVYLASGNRWSKNIDDGLLAHTAEQSDDLMRLGEQSVKENKVVGLYLVGVLEVDGKIKAEHIKERIRTLGPTVRADLGKQSEGTAGHFPALDN